MSIDREVLKEGKKGRKRKIFEDGRRRPNGGRNHGGGVLD